MNPILPYKMYYESSSGVIVRLDEPPFVAVDSDLWSSGWKMTTAPRPGRDGGRVISRKRQSDEKKLRIAAVADSAGELSDALEWISGIFAVDVHSMRPGKLWVNGWYLSCYCAAEVCGLSPDHTHMAEITLTLLAENPLWCSERTFTPQEGSQSEIPEHKYLYKYPYKYGSNIYSTYHRIQMINNSGISQPMRITFLGPCSNPAIIIGSTEIGIGGYFAEGERAVIDQQPREIYVVGTNGSRRNIFSRRLKNGQVFYPAPPGSYTVGISNAENAEIILITQKGAPPWSN